MTRLPILTSVFLLIALLAWTAIGTGFISTQTTYKSLLASITSTQKSEPSPPKTVPQSGLQGRFERTGNANNLSKKTASGLNMADQSARSILRKAQEQLTQYGSLSAKIREVIRADGKEFRGEGVYLQGSHMQLRMECTMKANRSTGKMLQVCDGQLLWTQLQFGEIPPNTPRDQWGRYLRITRRNVGKILEEAALGGNDPRNFLTAELGIGGLPALLASIDTSIDFENVQIDQIRGYQCYLLEGTWKPKIQERWDTIRKKFPKNYNFHRPDRVRLYLDPKSLFPSRIVYLKQIASSHSNKTSSLIPLMAIEFYDVVTNVDIAPERFRYIPPEGVTPKDVTHEYILQLRQLR